MSGQLLGPPRRRPGEVWEGFGRLCVLYGRHGYSETWELVGLDPDDTANWRLRSAGVDEHPLVLLWRWVRRLLGR